MHETAVAESLLDTLLDLATKHKAKPLKAKISYGSFSCINEEVLNFAFEAVSKGTICENMILEYEKKPVMADCKKCGNKFEFEINSPLCPYCESEEYSLNSEPPLTLETVEFED